MKVEQRQKIINEALKIPGWMREKELWWIVNTIVDSAEKIGLKDNPPPFCYAEIGSYCGRSLLAAGLALPKGSVLVSVDQNMFGRCYSHEMGIDPKVDYTIQSINHVLGILRRRKRGKLHKNNCWNTSTNSNEDLIIVPIVGDSTVATDIFRWGCFDLVFIDGDHHYDSVYNDISNWSGLVRTGGTLCGHDYCEEFDGVRKAVDELVGEVEIVDTIWAKHNFTRLNKV